MRKRTIIALGLTCLTAVIGIAGYGCNVERKSVYPGDENKVLISHLRCLYYEIGSKESGFSIYSPPPGDKYFSFQIADFNGDDKNELLVYVTSKSIESSYYNLYRVNEEGEVETKKGQLSDLVTNKEALLSQRYDFRSDHIELCENNLKEEQNKD